MRKRIVPKNTKPKEKNVNPFPKGHDTMTLSLHDYTVEQTLSGVCYAWPNTSPKVFVRSLGKSWYWVIPFVTWSDGDAGYGLYDDPVAALEDGRSYYLSEVLKNGKEENL